MFVRKQSVTVQPAQSVRCQTQAVIATRHAGWAWLSQVRQRTDAQAYPDLR